MERLRIEQYRKRESVVCRRPASSIHDVVEGYFGVLHDLVKNAFAQVSFAVDRDGCSTSVGMNENGMASRLSVQ
jgi:hypothetical protein